MKQIYSHLMPFQFLEWVIQYVQPDSLARQPQVLSKQKMHQPVGRWDVNHSTQHNGLDHKYTMDIIIPTFVLIDFSRSCLFIDLTIFGTSCFSSHLGLCAEKKTPFQYLNTSTEHCVNPKSTYNIFPTHCKTAHNFLRPIDFWMMKVKLLI